MINIKFNGKECKVAIGKTILEAARDNHVDIPTLCWLKNMNEIGACRICVVEIEGWKSLVAACVYKFSQFDEGKNILTKSPAVLQSRKTTLQLMLSEHKRNCLSCVRSANCELQTLCKELGVDDETRFSGSGGKHYEIDDSSIALYRDNSKCISCRRCVAACKNQDIGVIGANHRGIETTINCAFDMDLGQTTCVSCGQCINLCPTGALSEKDSTAAVWNALADTEKVVVVQTAPAVRASLGEAFGYPMGTEVQGKMAAALRELGFNYVFDTNFGADLTIMEEAHELLERVKNGGVLPMITSCSPGWVSYCEAYHPELIPNLSSCKSPQQMQGAMIKTYWAEKMNIDPSKIFSVSVMPCTAKKFELSRDNQSAAGKYKDIDASITTRELARMIEKAGIRFTDLPDADFDSAMGAGTGGAVIFGASGGVMEAALRVAGDVKVNTVVVSGLANAKALLEKVKSGEEKYDFIEVMACPGGCVNGGGQIIVPSKVRNFTDVAAERRKVLRGLDEANSVKKSSDSPDIKKVYAEFLGEVGGHKAHELLHTKYKATELNK
jgi:NADP-reducing hydrogenase subunit HndD